LITGFTEIVTVVSTMIPQYDGTPQVTVEADATLIFNSFREVCSPPTRTAPR
jgi:hypothetical protein